MWQDVLANEQLSSRLRAEGSVAAATTATGDGVALAQGVGGRQDEMAAVRFEVEASRREMREGLAKVGRALEALMSRNGMGFA